MQKKKRMNTLPEMQKKAVNNNMKRKGLSKMRNVTGIIFFFLHPFDQPMKLAQISLCHSRSVHGEYGSIPSLPIRVPTNWPPTVIHQKFKYVI